MIWLVGHKGMLGRELTDHLGSIRADFCSSDVEIDILDQGKLFQFAKNKNIQWIINCAAYTNVEKAEDEEKIATDINAIGAKNLAALAKSLNATLIHISTDYVFDGTKQTPYLETDATNPKGAYGRSKLLGEALIQSETSRVFILRTAWLYGNTGPSFVHSMLRLMNERKELKIVSDQIGSPTYAKNLSGVISSLIKKGGVPHGIYHYSDDGKISWHEFGLRIYEYGKEFGLIKNDCQLIPISYSEYPSKVARPSFSLLSKEKIRAELNCTIPDWQDSLKTFLGEDFKKWAER